MANFENKSKAAYNEKADNYDYSDLKSNGTIYIADVYLPAFWRVLLNPFVPLSKAGDVKFYSPKEIVKNFEQFGFINTGIKISGNIQVISMQKQ